MLVYSPLPGLPGIELFVVIEYCAMSGFNLEQGLHGRLVYLQLPLPSSMAHKL